MDTTTGAPMRGSVSRSRADGSFSPGRGPGNEETVGDGGRFQFDLLEPGHYTLFARSGDLVGELETIVGPGQEVRDLKLFLREGATLSVVYRGTTEGVVYQTDLGRRPRTRRLPPDRPSRVTVIGGRYTVQATIPQEEGESRTVTREVDLVDGEETFVEFDDDAK